ncbi:hypothetical protein [Streptomyces sp. NBC_01304]|uniref:hypothetical protein n=1 Tax=Streptomyces sp. NBC_01304 TaxID=2903818 RepID=UPI002E10C672|nr:hypothetical protein OG430_42270 [Streptomyces sp. NBC_01304]
MSLFRPTRSDRGGDDLDGAVPDLAINVIEPPVLPPHGTAIEFDIRVPPSGALTLISNKQCLRVHQALAGRTLSV